MNVCAYVRVSTDKQADKGYSVSEQTERVTSFCKAKEWNLIKIYTDGGYTGSNMNRPALQEMIKDIENYDIVLVNKLDRLSRSQKDTLYLIQDVFAPHGCSFVSMQESFDTTTPIGIAMVGILSAFAQLERSQIKERMKMGKEGRKKKGLWHGGVNIPTGYDYKDGKLIPNDEADQVRLIYKMYLDGTSIRDITRFLSTHYTTRYTSWNYVGTVRKILENELYIGMIGEYKGQHEPLIDLDTFEKVQAKLSDNQNQSKRVLGKHLLTGMCYCGYCGNRVRSVTTASKKMKYSYYRCGSSDFSSLDKIDNKCELKPHKEAEIDEIIYREILKLKFEDVKISEKKEKLPDNSAEIEKLTKQINRLIDLYTICGDDKLEELSKKIKDLKAKRSALEKIKIRPKKVVKSQIMNTLSVARETIENGTIEDKKAIANSLINKVTMYNDKIEIEWKFL